MSAKITTIPIIGKTNIPIIPMMTRNCPRDAVIVVSQDISLEIASGNTIHFVLYVENVGTKKRNVHSKSGRVIVAGIQVIGLLTAIKNTFPHVSAAVKRVI